VLRSTFASAPAALAPDTLACIRFGGPAAAGADPRHVRVALQPLAGAPACETWSADGPVTQGRADGFGFARSDAVLFGQLSFDGPDFSGAVQDAYARLVAFCAQQGYPHLLRCWNYFGDIHGGTGDAERYRQFCVGRHRALATTQGFEQRLPAATVIGSPAPGALVYFFAAREAGLQVENPRQVPAFKYPRSYAPLPPSFSRALLKRWGDEEQLFVSGTASVVGHESHHPDNTAAQLKETLANLRALLKAAGADTPWRPLGMKAYLRRDGDLGVVRAGDFGPVDWHAGSALQCNWQNRGRYFPGVVEKMDGERIQFLYADGDRETMTISRCRASAPPVRK
jgi:chorismate lyase/3-hydroxybenzoate synthase